MKKTKLFLFFIPFQLIFFVAACGQQSQKNEGNSFSQSEAMNTSAQNDPSAEALYERLMVSFDADWIERESDPDLYPDYFGGAFVKDNGQFVVTVTGNRDEYRKRLKDILGTDKFDVETVHYSYSQMMKVMDKIDAFLMDSAVSEEHPVITRFAGAYPDVMENRVKVLLTRTDDASVRLFRKEVIDSPLIVFEQGEVPEF